ncbi:serine dehydratase subunit alpha family protein [bacterium AH-315-L21]|nr:serine dehydratase subunit alpha family protein [bacterium AH-315-L21]
MKEQILALLKSEVKPAMGCTEPVAVALACSKAMKLGCHDDISSIKITVSPNIYKNGLSVGIPHTKEVGLLVAGAMGALGGDSDLGLNVLKLSDSKTVKDAILLVDDKKVHLAIKDTDEKIYIDVILESAKGKSQVIIQGSHTNYILLKLNETIILDKAKSNDSATRDNTVSSMRIRDIIEEIESMEYADLSFLIEGLKMNEKVADFGLNQKRGIGVGYTIKKGIETGNISEDLTSKAMYMTAAGADARMSGVTLPVMSSSGSGNNGLTAILPLVAYMKMYDVSGEKISKALAISHTINCVIKNHIGSLSALCSCGISAATGASAAITWLKNGSKEQIEGAINNMIANVSGMICDGAKDGCALKLATAASTSVYSSILALNGSIVQPRNGIIGNTVEESIKNLGLISEKGMKITDHVILDLMKDMDERCC